MKYRQTSLAHLKLTPPSLIDTGNAAGGIIDAKPTLKKLSYFFLKAHVVTEREKMY